MLLPLGLSVLVPAAGAAAAPPPSAVAHPGAGTDSAAGSGVRVERGRISANIGEAPMAPILGAVGRDLGAEVLVRGDLGLTRAQAFADLPLLDGLERLIQPNHLVIEFAPQRQGVVPRIMRIRVFGLGAATDPSIEPVVLGAAGGSNSAAAAQNSPVAGFDGHLGWSYDNPSRLPPLAQRVRRIGSIYAASGTSGLDALQTVVASDPDSAARAAAVRAAAGFAYQDAVPLIQSALTDESIDVRLAAVSSINPDPSQPPMFLVDTIVNEEEDPRVRLTALERLGRFNDDEQVQDALNDIALSTDPRINQAAQALINH